MQLNVLPNWREVIDNTKKNMQLLKELSIRDVERPGNEQNSFLNGLKEYIYLYISIVLVMASNFFPDGNWSLFLSLALALAVLIFTGWVKKIAETKINAILVQSGFKDKEIAMLKEVKSKLEAEIGKLVETLTFMSNSPQEDEHKPAEP